MTHNAAHIILKLSTPLNSERPKGVKAWHCLLAVFAIGLVLGAFIF